MIMRDPLISTERTDLYIQSPFHLLPLMQYYKDNRTFLSPWEPRRDSSYFQRTALLERLEQAQELFNSGQSVQLAAMDRKSGELMAIVNFTGIIRGPFQACFLGYSLAESFQGSGYMFEILNDAIPYMFEEKKLHRIMANYMPCNQRSEKLLDRLGFEKEGLARDYLQINGRWEDHILTSLINHRMEA